MNDNLKPCKTCMHYYRSKVNPSANWCFNPNFTGWDMINGEFNHDARTVRQDEYMCGINAVGHERRLTLHERLSSHWHGVIFGASLLLVGLGLVVAIEGSLFLGILTMGTFAYAAWWGYQGLPEV